VNPRDQAEKNRGLAGHTEAQDITHGRENRDTYSPVLERPVDDSHMIK
jgi:hypothetical protein